jgi:hypothetical protein
MGGIYTLGPSPGTRLIGNRIHDVWSYSYGGWGIYNDEGSSDIVVESNLVYRTRTGGYHQHYGRENRIANNIFAFSSGAQIQRSRAESHRSFSFERNIVYWGPDGTLLNGSWQDANFTVGSNLYWTASTNPVLFGSLTFAEWQATGRDAGSMIGDPLFANPEQGDFRIKACSPAFALGFVPLDPGAAGVYGGRRWRELAGSLEYPPVEAAAPALPLPASATSVAR